MLGLMHAECGAVVVTEKLVGTIDPTSEWHAITSCSECGKAGFLRPVIITPAHGLPAEDDVDQVVGAWVAAATTGVADLSTVITNPDERARWASHMARGRVSTMVRDALERLRQPS